MIEEATMPTPIGEVWWASRGGAIVALGFDVQMASLRARVGARFAGETVRAVNDAGGARRPLESYFGGELRALEALAVDVAGTTLQKRVWGALREIPIGETRSYAAVAASVGAPRAARAIGSANAQNPVSLVVPCHRVIAVSGALTGYAGGEERKRWLLAHEGARFSSSVTPALRPRTENAARDRAPRASSGFAG